MSDGVSQASRLRVRYAETDQMGIAYHGNYFAWFEVGRCDWLRMRGWSYRELEADGTQLPVIEAHSEYRRPARYDDELEIRTTGRLLSVARIRFEYDVVLVATGDLAARGYTVHAAVDSSGRPKRLPERARVLFA